MLAQIYLIGFIVALVAFAWFAPKSKTYSDDKQIGIAIAVLALALLWFIVYPIIVIMWIMDASIALARAQKEKGK